MIPRKMYRSVLAILLACVKLRPQTWMEIVMSPVSQGLPLRAAIGRYGPHPLAFSVRSIAAHPRFDLRDLTEYSILNPLFCVGKRTRAFVLQSDLYHAI